MADEHRNGLLPVVRRSWGLKGVRAKAPYKTTYQWMYVYEALEEVEICQKVVDEVSQAGIMGLNKIHHDTHAQLIHTI